MADQAATPKVQPTEGSSTSPPPHSNQTSPAGPSIDGASNPTATRLDHFSKDNPWYYKNVSAHIPLLSRKLLEEYSHIPPADVDAHISKWRDILWSHAPYPCVGEFRFLRLNITSHPRFHDVTALLRSDGYFLDLGCGVAQEMRALAYAGIPSARLFGSDLHSSFLSASYDLFNDKDSFKGTLVEADIFSDSLFENKFAGWENKFKIIHAGLFLHLFDWDHQLLICNKVVRMLEQKKGAIFLGEMAGINAGGGQKANKWLHDEESFAKFWKEVEKQTGTDGQWKVKTTFKARPKGRENKGFFTGDGVGWLTFSMEKACKTSA